MILDITSRQWQYFTLTFTGDDSNIDTKLWFQKNIPQDGSAWLAIGPTKYLKFIPD